MMHTDEVFMQRCLDLAKLGIGKVSPNPLVGAVIVYNGRIIGEGYHEQYGGHHAEVNAFLDVKEKDKHLVRSATLYVNLEPCAHHGNTPPCANRIVAEGIPKVVIGAVDTNPKVGGKGIKILEDAGIEVTSQVLVDECRWLNRVFYTNMEKKRPYVLLKFAESADGYIGQENERISITTPLTNRLSHKWRSEIDAILVGRQTVVADNPQLTTRLWFGTHPIRLILDSKGVLTKQWKVFDESAKTMSLVHTSETNAEQTLVYDGSLQDLLVKLYENKICSVLIEGGAKVLQSFIDSQLWDEAKVLSASKFIEHGIPSPEIEESIGIDTMLVATDKVTLLLPK